MKAIAAILLAISPLVHAQSAEEIMASVRHFAVVAGDLNVGGVIKFDPVPGHLKLAPKIKENFRFRFNEDSKQLRVLIDGNLQEVPHTKIADLIPDTNVSYEDLAFKFLYWRNPRIVGQEKYQGRDCWRVHVENPGDAGSFREVSIWVSQNPRALMRVVGYGKRPAGVDAMPQALKQFEISEVMKLNKANGRFTVKTMTVTSYGSENQTVGSSRIEFEKP